ncbi:hypothetical protein TRICI_006802 [Trichomonascus ciferrii]|uniref:Uncharacterized protein n=1 Tax=Trichomonascus ciferrii TaxID=44093 RepID=A0A642UHE8_9ASCO|nr:hypothetical protein TRICI_006802 [Trichomonascus ciferrii]
MMTTTPYVSIGSADSYSFQFNTATATPPSSGRSTAAKAVSSSPPVVATPTPVPSSGSGLNINFSSSVNPSMLLYPGLDDGPMDNLPSSSPAGPQTPKTFSSIIHSSPSIYSPVEFSNNPFGNSSNNNKLSSPLSFSASRGGLAKRGRNVSNLKISHINNAQNELSYSDIGPLSAPAPIRSSSSSSSLKRRVSLNISDGGRAAVVEDFGPEVDIPRSKSTKCFRTSVPMTRNYTDPVRKHANTIYDRSIDYWNDSARRMSLESLFPELSPQLQQQTHRNEHSPSSCSETNSTATSDSEETAISASDFNILSLKDNDQDDDDDDDDDNDPKKDETTDARFALKRVLERNSSTKSFDSSTSAMHVQSSFPTDLPLTGLLGPAIY